MELTHKQEQFCQYIMDGHSSTDSYRLAYQPVCSDSQVTQRASRLRNHNSNVVSRLNTLMAINQEASSLSKVDVISDVVSLARSIETKPSDRLKAYELLSKLCGYLVNRSEVLQHSTVEHSISSLTIDELRRLVEISENPLVINGDNTSINNE